MRNVWAHLDSGVFRRNLNALRKPLRSGVELVLDLKSNAYGHGALEVAQCAWHARVKTFLMSTVAEASAVRAKLPAARLIVAEQVDPDDISTILQEQLMPMISSEGHARALAEKAADQLEAVQCHAEVDTGLGQAGFDWEEAAQVLPRLGRTAGIKIVGLCSQFVRMDPWDEALVVVQLARFYQVSKACQEKGIRPLFRHLSDSQFFLRSDVWAQDGARPGLLIYGYSTAHPLHERIHTEPCLQWCTRVAQIRHVPAGFPVGHGHAFRTERETCLATLPVGYADGYPARMANNGYVLVSGKRCAVVGTVDSNAMTIDLGVGNSIPEGQTVVLMGRDGDEAVWADEIAALCNMGVHEVLASIRS